MSSELVHVIRTAEWRIVQKLLAVEPLTLKSGIAAPRSPINNRRKFTVVGDRVLTFKPSEQTAAVKNLVNETMEGWDDHATEESDVVPSGGKVIFM